MSPPAPDRRERADASPRPPSRAPNRSWKPQRMTRWFEPLQLVQTGVRALLSAIFGAYADQREIQAALDRAAPAALHDYSDRPETWIDYAADTGDGFDSTYTLAWLLGRQRLPESTLPEADEPRQRLAATRRGDLLILGGDQVYPTASRSQYENRFSGPFEAALPWVEEDVRPHLFSIPGNHDWYDGLTSFMRLFCQRRSIGAWQTRQQRSYFAIELPHRWWLLGIDIQLASDIDQPQLSYFKEVAERIAPGDHVILCTAQPSWVEDPARAYRNLLFFERSILCPRQARLMLTLTGDLHHYAHYAEPDGARHKVTAGGGGAYLYGTHRLPETIELPRLDPDRTDAERQAEPETETYARGAAYPDLATSRRLRLGALRLGPKNPGFVLALGLIYLLYGWLLQSASQGSLLTQSLHADRVPMNALLGWLGQQPLTQMLRVLRVLAEITVQTPGLVVIAAVLIVGLYLYCQPDPGRGRWRRVIGLVHGVAHLLAIFLLTWAFAHLNAALGLHAPGHGRAWLQGALYIAEMLLIGGPLASFLFSLALLPGVNFNDAYSAQHIPHYKNFLRLHLREDGSLTVYPIGVRRVVRWREDTPAQPHQPTFRPRKDAPKVHLIEDPFTIPGPAATRTAAPANPSASA